MDVRGGFARLRRDREEAFAHRWVRRAHENDQAEAARREDPVERLARIVDRPAPPPSKHADFNAAIRRLARGDEPPQED